MASYSVFKKSWLAWTSNWNIQGYNPQQSSSTRVNCVRLGALTIGTNGLKSARWSCCNCFAATIRQVGFLVVPSVVALILQILLSVLTLGQKQRFEMIHANVMFLRNVYRARTVCTERCRLHPWEIPEVKIKLSHSLIRSTCSLLYPVGIFSVQISSSISLAQTQRTIAFCQGTGKRQ